MSHEEFLTDLTFSPDGRWLATASFDRTARVWDSATGLEVARVTHEDQVTRLAFSPDGMWVASTGRDNATKVWEAATGREVARITHDERARTRHLESARPQRCVDLCDRVHARPRPGAKRHDRPPHDAGRVDHLAF